MQFGITSRSHVKTGDKTMGKLARSASVCWPAKVVVLVYTERPRGPHVISLRKAEKHEARYYRQVAKENLG